MATMVLIHALLQGRLQTLRGALPHALDPQRRPLWQLRSQMVHFIGHFSSYLQVPPLSVSRQGQCAMSG